MTFRYSTLYGRKQTSSELKIIEVLNQTLYKEHLCIRGAVLDFERKFWWTENLEIYPNFNSRGVRFD
jgi:hypothetical protein